MCGSFQELLDIQTFLLQHIPQNMTQPELPTYLHSSVQELLHRTSGSLFGGPTERAEPRSLVLSHGTMEAYTLDRGAVAASFDLAAHSFFASLTPPGSRKAGYGLLVYPRKAAVQDTVQSNEPGAGVTASASPMHGSAESPGDAAAAALPSVSAPQALKQAGAVPEAQVGTAWGWSGCLCRRGWTRRWLCMGGDPHAEARDAASPSRPIATYLFSAEAERDTWLQIISRWQRSLQQSSTPSPVRPVGPELGSHVNSTALTWCGALFGWASWPLGCCIPVCRPRRALKSAGAGGVPQWENVVFSGGGIKGLVFPAALGAVADCYGPDGRGLGWIKGVAGVSAGIALYNLLGGSMNISAPWVSAGSVVATLVACGCKVDEIKASAATLNLMHLSAGMSTLQGVSPPARPGDWLPGVYCRHSAGGDALQRPRWLALMDLRAGGAGAEYASHIRGVRRPAYRRDGGRSHLPAHGPTARNLSGPSRSVWQGYCSRTMMRRAIV